MVTSMSDTATNHLPLLAEPRRGKPQLATQGRDVRAAPISQLDVLEVLPDAFVRVQVGCIPWQLLDLQALGAAVGHEVLDDVTAVDGRAIPDHQQQTRDVAQEVTEKPNHVRAAERALLSREVQPSLQRNAADDSHVITRQRYAQDRRLSPRRIGPRDTWQQVETRLIYPDDATPFSLGPFFSAGQRSAYHAAMVCSLRWVARRIGFWTLQCMARRRRLTCVRW